MTNGATDGASISVIVPSNNEAGLIDRCLAALAESQLKGMGPVQVIVVANGCDDDTADRARVWAPRFDALGWDLQVLELAQGGKLAALNAGDAVARAPIRAYLDADVTLDPGLMAQIIRLLDSDKPLYASGRVRIVARGWVARAYARIWRQVPFMRHGVPGCGLFAVNTAGRARWDQFPDIISDDTFVRLSFAPQERLLAQAGYDWPIAEGMRALVRVRRRQDAGVDQIRETYPDLLVNEDSNHFPMRQKLDMALRAPVGFAIYSLVAIVSKRTRHRAQGWSRSR
jgi:glycosyltransferase involved in cell wall biosynthesis